LVDLLVQTATQLVFAVIGVLLLARLGGTKDLIAWLSAGLLVMTLAVAGFFTTQRLGIFRLLEEALVRVARNPGWGALANLTKLDDGLKIIHARHAALAVAFCVHLIVWFIGALEIWIALAYMGYSVGYSEALTIESLGQAARAVGFLIPAGLGVQEGG